MGKELVRTNSESLLIRYAHLSGREIEEKTGIPAIEALQKINDLLDSRDWLTVRREERLLIIEMQDLIHSARDRLEHASEDNYAAIANVALRGFKEIGLRYDQRRKNLDIDISEITAAQAHVFGGAYDTSLSHLIDSMMIAHPELERAEMMQYAREGLVLARKKLGEFVGEV